MEYINIGSIFSKIYKVGNIFSTVEDSKITLKDSLCVLALGLK